MAAGRAGVWPVLRGVIMSLRKSSCDSLASAAGAPRFAAIPLGSAGLANAGPEAEKRGEEGAQRPTRAREDKETSARGHRDRGHQCQASFAKMVALD